MERRDRAPPPPASRALQPRPDTKPGLARILQITLNGRVRTHAVADNILLLDYLREIVGLTGTKTGCDGGECGACTVLVDDMPRLSCLTLAASVEGRRVDTIESLAQDGHLSTRSSDRNAAIARLATSWRRRGCFAATPIQATLRSARRLAATFAAAPVTSKSSRR